MQFINHTFNYHFLDIDIITEKTDETELLKKTAVLFRKLFKGMLGNKIFLPQIFQ